jgi:hypothetical protein
MTGWSREDAIAMERRHVAEGEKRVARQEAIAAEPTSRGHDQLAIAIWNSQGCADIGVLLRFPCFAGRASLRDAHRHYSPSEPG